MQGFVLEKILNAILGHGEWRMPSKSFKLFRIDYNIEFLEYSGEFEWKPLEQSRPTTNYSETLGKLEHDSGGYERW